MLYIPGRYLVAQIGQAKLELGFGKRFLSGVEGEMTRLIKNKGDVENKNISKVDCRFKGIDKFAVELEEEDELLPR